MRILAVDISHIFRVNWEASEGKEYSAAFNRTIDQVSAHRVGFDRAVLACDSGASFRKVVPEYKANRKDPGEAYRAQLRRTIDRLKADGCVELMAPQVGTFSSTGAPSFAEADDVFCWVADRHSDEIDKLEGDARAAWALTILSGDGDMEQLVDDSRNITVKKLDGSIWTEATVLEKRGVPVGKIVDLKALCGDNSDNYKPFPGEFNEATKKHGPGIGEGTAAKFVQAFGGALAVFDDLDREVDGKKVINPHLRKILDMHGKKAAEKGIFLATVRGDLNSLDWAAVLAEPVVSKIVEARTYEPEQPVEVESEPVVLPPAVPAPLAIRAPQAVIQTSSFDTLALQPKDPGGLWKLSETLFNSRVYAQFPNVESVFACVFEARERGVKAGVALRNAYIVKGKLAWSAAFMVGLVKDSGLAKVFRIVETTDRKAVLEYQHAKDEAPRLFEFTIEEAQRANWLKSGERGDNKWITNPRSMLRWAAMRECVRFVWPEIVAGIYTPDELRGGGTQGDEYEEPEAA